MFAVAPSAATPEDREPISIGRPSANNRVAVLGRDGRPVLLGSIGELCVGELAVNRGGLARSYLNMPGRTAAVFVPDALASLVGGRLYRTGDLGRQRPDGELEFLGRIDHQVKVRGLRIELGEVEAVLSTHPDVASCAVVARQQRLVAFVVSRDGTTGRWRAFLEARLPAYMVPSLFVAADALPLLPSGKVDRG